FVSDLEYLQDLYERVNARDPREIDAVCPDCGEEFALEVQPGRETAVLAGHGDER
ncbi:MAG: hypothetical protein ACI8XM_002643, partial [Haloarculaceae archaeon]